MKSRRRGRTFEGTIMFMLVAVLAACLIPTIVAYDRSTPDGAACVASLVAWGVAEDAPTAARCPVDAQDLRAETTTDGVALTCSGQHLASWPARVERRADGTWRLAQDLPPAPDLTSEREVATGGWFSRSTARAAGDTLVVSTRPAVWVQLVLAPLLALASIAIAYVFEWEQTHGWRPGGAPTPPSRAGLLARVALVSVVNPCGLGAIALWTLERRLEVGYEHVVLHPPLGESHVIDRVEAGALVPTSDGRGRVVLVRQPVEGEAGWVAEGVLTVSPSEAGLARLLIDTASR
jgi:hypothetical protein